MSPADTAAEPSEKIFHPTIEPNIPIPPKPRPTRAKSQGLRIQWPFHTMQIGDSILLPAWADVSRVFAAVSKAKGKGQLPQSFKIQFRKTEAGDRFWRIG